MSVVLLPFATVSRRRCTQRMCLLIVCPSLQANVTETWRIALRTGGALSEFALGSFMCDGECAVIDDDLGIFPQLRCGSKRKVMDLLEFFVVKYLVPRKITA